MKTHLILAIVVSLVLCTGGLCYSSDGVPISDGPYIISTEDGSSIVYYVCDGELLQQSFEPTDTLRFKGLCSDSTVEFVAPIKQPQIQSAKDTDVKQFLAISDIHGAYDEFVAMLKATKVIDTNGDWSWDSGQLIINGDVFDRGAKVTEALWLIFRLEQQAQAAGGKVHFILGNHEVMVMQGDERYVNQKYQDGIVAKTGLSHQNLFGPNSLLGKWLRSKSVMVQINDVLFVHAGVSPDLIDKFKTIEDVNELLRRSLDIPRDELASGSNEKFLYGSRGPIWERGLVWDMEDKYPRTTPEQVDAILAHFGVSKIVVGHCEGDNIECEYDCKVITLDIPVENENAFQALLYENNLFYRIETNGQRTILQ